MIQKSSIELAAGAFFDAPNKAFELMELSKKINIAHTSTKKNLQLLTKSGIIVCMHEKKGKRTFPTYKADKSSTEFRKYKKMYNYWKLIESDLEGYIQKKLSPKSIVLFGSYARGEDDETSDIDIFVECHKESIDLKKFEKILDRNIQLHFKEDFRTYPKELKNNVVNGIVLGGYLEAYR